MKKKTGMAVIEHLKLYTEYGSLHGIGHFLQASRFRSYKMRLFWCAIVFVALFACGYLQINLLLDILSKQTSVDVFYERRNSAKLPTVLICDMNHELDKGQLFMKQFLGNSTLLYMHTAILSRNDLFEAIRRDIRKNLSSLEKYPSIERDYQHYYEYINPEFLSLPPVGKDIFDILE